MLWLDGDDSDWAHLHALALMQRVHIKRQSVGTMTSDTQAWIVTSGTQPGVTYVVDVESSPAGVSCRCGCLGHKHGQPCKHLSIVLEHIGLLRLPVQAVV